MPRSVDTPGYTLTDLSRHADVTPRTVRYYVAQGLLPSPGALGPASRYGEGHLGRLRLIRRLQRHHLPLAEIRRQVVELSDEEVAAALAEPELRVGETVSGGSALDYIRTVLGKSDPRRVDPPRYRLHAPLRVQGLALSASFAPSAGPASLREGGKAVGPSLAPPPPTVSDIPDRSQWERIALTPDVELHVRRPLSRHQNRRVDRLLAIARELLEEDPS